MDIINISIINIYSYYYYYYLMKVDFTCHDKLTCFCPVYEIKPIENVGKYTFEILKKLIKNDFSKTSIKWIVIYFLKVGVGL